MATIIDEKLAIWLASHDYFYIMHRFDEASRIPFMKKMKELNLYTSISVGVKPQEYDFVEELSRLNLVPDYITIDIAHGHSQLALYTLKNSHHF